jgi:hypothetical protein
MSERITKTGAPVIVDRVAPSTREEREGKRISSPP